MTILTFKPKNKAKNTQESVAENDFGADLKVNNNINVASSSVASLRDRVTHADKRTEEFSTHVLTGIAKDKAIENIQMVRNPYGLPGVQVLMTKTGELVDLVIDAADTFTEMDNLYDSSRLSDLIDYMSEGETVGVHMNFVGNIFKPGGPIECLGAPDRKID